MAITAGLTDALKNLWPSMARCEVELARLGGPYRGYRAALLEAEHCLQGQHSLLGPGLSLLGPGLSLLGPGLGVLGGGPLEKHGRSRAAGIF